MQDDLCSRNAVCVDKLWRTNYLSETGVCAEKHHELGQLSYRVMSVVHLELYLPVFHGAHTDFESCAQEPWEEDVRWVGNVRLRKIDLEDQSEPQMDRREGE